MLSLNGRNHGTVDGGEGCIKAMGKRIVAGEPLSQVTMVMVMFNFETSRLENKSLN